ncbi:hypothetical protein GS506_16090 [Rhodococcus hoagii]|nr:hypothetical protein [Prescottella equi]
MTWLGGSEPPNVPSEFGAFVISRDEQDPGFRLWRASWFLQWGVARRRARGERRRLFRTPSGKG